MKQSATVFFATFLLTAALAHGQSPAASGPPPPVQQPLPPATQLEGFKPSAGSVTTLGYDEVGRLGPGFSTSGLVLVEVRELRSATGQGTRGMTVQVTESQYRDEIAYVDADEMPDLLKGLDALLALKTNPTTFKSFEVRYTTRGNLELVAFNSSKGDILYGISAGRITRARKSAMNSGDLQKLRAFFQAAADRVAAAK